MQQLCWPFCNLQQTLRRLQLSSVDPTTAETIRRKHHASLTVPAREPPSPDVLLPCAPSSPPRPPSPPPANPDRRLGSGTDRSKNGSKQWLTFPQVRHVMRLCSWPQNMLVISLSLRERWSAQALSACWSADSIDIASSVNGGGTERGGRSPGRAVVDNGGDDDDDDDDDPSAPVVPPSRLLRSSASPSRKKRRNSCDIVWSGIHEIRLWS